MIATAVNYKICTKCKIEKRLTEFSRDRRAIDGRASQCKTCNKIYLQSRVVETAEKKKARCSTVDGHLRHLFDSMKQRCNNPKVPNYKYYGGRGIKVLFECSEFVDYVIFGLQVDPRELQIDRIDNDGHYEPGNIRFVTPKVNCQNRRPYKKKKSKIEK